MAPCLDVLKLELKFPVYFILITMIFQKVPILGVELARHKIPKAYLSRAITQATIFGEDPCHVRGPMHES